MVRIVKRTELSMTKSILFRVAAVLGALIASSVFIILLGHNPLDVYLAMVKGALGTSHRVNATILKTIPLIITSLGIAVAFKMKFWNIGADGQIFMGAFAASYFALNFSHLPKPILLIVMVIAGIIGGGIWGLIPGFFKAQFGTNETLFTLMMNYIALKWVVYLQYGPWKDPNANGFPKIANFTDNAVLPKVFGIHIGWIAALILVVVIHVFIHYTKKGYEITVIGESENTARYAGMNVKKTILFAIFVSGGICGLAGMIQASAINNTLTIDASSGVGYTAIITTWLAQLSAPGIIAVSFLFAMMVQGGTFIQTAFHIPQSASLILQSMILFFVLSSEFFLQYQLVMQNRIKDSTDEKGELA